MKCFSLFVISGLLTAIQSGIFHAKAGSIEQIRGVQIFMVDRSRTKIVSRRREDYPSHSSSLVCKQGKDFTAIGKSRVNGTRG